MSSRFTRLAPFALIATWASIFAGACAHVSTQSARVITLDPRDPLGSLEQGLNTVHSDRVVVSTALLRSLVKNERIVRTQCKNISGQLEAIKNIDLEETK